MTEPMIQVLQPVVGAEELQYIQKVFESNWLGKGQTVKQFETEFARYLKAEPRRFTSTTCGTEALFLAAEVFDFHKGDEILVPSISFIAVGSAVVAKHAKLVLCDVDRRTLNVTADLLAPKIRKNTKAVFLTHYG